MATHHQEVIDLGSLLEGATAAATETTSVTAQRVVDGHNILGECVIYNDRDQTVLWTDIMDSKLYTLQLKKKSNLHCYTLPKKLGAFGLLEKNKKEGSLPLLCAWEDGFQLYDVATGKALSDMSTGQDVNPAKGESRLNDGRTDPTGTHFICGGFYGHLNVTMKVFKVKQQDGALSHEPIADGMEITNSICWTPDGSRMYLACSNAQTIHSHAYNPDFSATQVLSEKTLIHTKTKPCMPDGCIVDAKGFLWNAVWNRGDAPGRVERIDPSNGNVVFTVEMPDLVSQVSCCCFGGQELDILFITTASIQRTSDSQPHAGALYAAKVPFKGRLESRLEFSY